MPPRRKKKAVCNEGIDRISDLPNNLIDVILQRLAVQDLVKTSILSRKWRYMWASVSKLEFGENFFNQCEHLDYLETSSVVMEVLFLHNGPLHKFILYIPPNYPLRMECLTKWILFLSRKGVKVLELKNLQIHSYQIPSHIYSCQDLTYLHLQHFNISTVPFFSGFRSLVDLVFVEVIFEPGALESLISGCPLLGKLSISFCSGFDYISLPAPLLKTLFIEGDQAIESISFKQAPNLTSLTLYAWGSGDVIERASLYDLLKDLPKIERLSMQTGYIKNFSADINPQVQLRLVTYLNNLSLYGVNIDETAELQFIISLLRSSPNLEKLFIESYSEGGMPEVILKEFDCNECCFGRLQFVDITIKTAAYNALIDGNMDVAQNALVDGNMDVAQNALNLIRFLLAKSPSLEILTFKVEHEVHTSDAPKLLNIACDLLQMKRASVKVEVKFFYDD